MAIYNNDIANGDGVRVTLFVSGCSLHCDGCHNPEAQNFDAGQPLTKEVREKMYNLIKRPLIKGLTITGGHPLEEQNLSALETLIKEYKQKFKRKNLWLYTGYTWEYIQEHPRLKNICNKCDYVVEGPYEWWNRDINLKFRGSSNQRIIDVQKTRETKSIVLYDESPKFPVKPPERAVSCYANPPSKKKEKTNE